MIRVGIIGGIGSGKSFISKLFRYPVFNADDEVKYIYKNNKECFKKLKKRSLYCPLAQIRKILKLYLPLSIHL